MLLVLTMIGLIEAVAGVPFYRVAAMWQRMPQWKATCLRVAIILAAIPIIWLVLDHLGN
jgi:hypothetical protein